MPRSSSRGWTCSTVRTVDHSTTRLLRAHGIAVVEWTRPDAERRIVAYVQPVPGKPFDASSARAVLGLGRDGAEAGANPVRFIFVDRMDGDEWDGPTVDHLPRPCANREGLGGVDFVSPEGALEADVAEAWRDVLSAVEIGRFDNFQAIDGFSSLAAQVASRLHANHGYAVEPRDALNAHTVWELALLLQARADGGLAHEAAPGIESALSPSQEPFWIAQKRLPEASVHSVPMSWSIEGPLNIAALEWALATLVIRHETLRSVVHEASGQACLSPARIVDLQLRTLYLRRSPHASDVLEQLLREEAARPFRLDAEAPIRALLVRTDSDRHVLSMVVHRIGVDACSQGILCSELGVLYGAYAQGLPSPLTGTAKYYGDFSRRQRCLAHQDAVHRAYWQDALDYAPRTLELPLDRARVDGTVSDAATVDFPIDDATVARMRRLAAQARSTVFAVFAAALQVLLHEMTRETLIDIAYSVANRSDKEFADVVGCFASTLVLRTRVTPEDTFRSVLSRVDARIRANDEHAALPPAVALAGRTVPVAAPQVSLEFEPAGASKLWLGDCTATAHPRMPTQTATDLGWRVSHSAAGMTVCLEYAKGLFDEATVTNIGRWFLALLRTATSEPDRQIVGVSLVGSQIPQT